MSSNFDVCETLHQVFENEGKSDYDVINVEKNVFIHASVHLTPIKLQFKKCISIFVSGRFAL